VIDLIAGGYVIDNLGWRATFFMLSPFPILMMIFIQKRIKIEQETYTSFSIESIEPTDNKYQNGKSSIQRKWKSFQIIDIRGTVILALLIASFLIVLTNQE
jgi:MFS family permease